MRESRLLFARLAEVLFVIDIVIEGWEKLMYCVCYCGTCLFVLVLEEFHSLCFLFVSHVLVAKCDDRIGDKHHGKWGWF